MDQSNHTSDATRETNNGDWVHVDGSRGEGGGQVFRSSLALSLLTGRPVHFRNIRARRSKPGLLRQHLTALEAAARIGMARVEGAKLGSGEVRFEPQGIAGGHYRFDVGSAGSATLVIQTVLPALLAADGPTELRVKGGTHNQAAPPFPFLLESYLPQLRKMGAEVEFELVRAGYFPVGGGEIVARIRPAKLQPLRLLERSAVSSVEATAWLSGLPEHIAERELETVAHKLKLKKSGLRVERPESGGPGNILCTAVRSAEVTAVFSAFGKRGKPAEDVAADVCRQTRAYLRSEAPVEEHLADQLVLLLAIAGGGAFRCNAMSSHCRTQFETIGNFLNVPMQSEQVGPSLWEVRVGTDVRSEASAKP